jgi:hypothetical protein
MAQNFPNSPTNGDTTVINGITYTYVSASSKWRATQVGGSGAGSGGSGTTTYATIAELPLTGNAAGDQAFVSGNNRLYIWNGTGWYNIALINTAPNITQGGAGSYDLAIDGTPTVITLTAADPEEVPITWTYSVTSGSLTNGGGVTATVSQADNVFTITPTTTEAYAGTFSLTFTASDGVNIATDVNSFTLDFVTIVADSSYTTLLLQADAASTDNQTDASTNSFAITENGNVISTASTPYRSGGYSLQLDGNDYITTGFNDNFGTGDFTFECWAKTTVGGVIMAQYDNGSQAEAFEIGTADGIIRSHTDSGTEGAQGSQDLRDNQWHYLVWERHSGTYYYYVDGSLQASITNSENGQQSSGWYIGRFGVANTGYFTGELRDLKFTVGTAVYGGSAPSVPTESTVSGSETFVFATGLPYGKDLSTNGSSRTITNYGDPIFVPDGPYDYVPYDSATHGGSVYFDGSSNMTIPDNSVFDFGTDSFTIEAWINIDTTRGGYDRIVAGGTQADGANNQWFIGFWPGAQINVGYYNGSGFTETQFNVVSMPNETWHHVAIVRDGANIECFFNGESKGTWNIGTSTEFNTGSAGLIVGARYNNGSPIEPYHGYISDLRIVKGTAVYTADFTPPTEPLPAITNTQLLTGTNKNSIWDASSGKLLTLVGDTTASTTQTKYSNSIYFDDSGDYISVTVDPPLAGDFTCEAWVRFDSISAGNQIICSFGSYAPALFYRSASNDISIYHGTAFYQSGFNPSANTWYHIAMAREGTSVRVFIDGTQYGTTQTYSTSITSTNLRIGYDGNDYFGGYIEDFRYTKGLARYTANFTPPTGSLEG